MTDNRLREGVTTETMIRTPALTALIRFDVY